ncbi:MAG: hypothetical protein DHS20C04_01950 [Hyphococcus sp.]|nr:MAG: hypothetical protein DHS20C04_01950 [Marinicaulis sp.]
MIAAPARAASIEASAISSEVTGKYGLMVGVWIEPVTAQVIITFRPVPAVSFSLFCDAAAPFGEFFILPDRTLFRHSVNQ